MNANSEGRESQTVGSTPSSATSLSDWRVGEDGRSPPRTPSSSTKTVNGAMVRRGGTDGEGLTQLSVF